MKNLENMTKKELLEVIDNKEEELSTLIERLVSIEELEAYNDKVNGMYDNLVNKGFKSSEAIEIVKTMISSGIINERRPPVLYPYGYHKKEVIDPLILEEEDYRTEPEKWNNILELCGFEPNSHVNRIVLNVSTIEYFMEETQQ